ncbi:hypothetical protein ACVW0Y_004437, partial [Pseudomonas sp. TE3786]
NRLRCSTKHLLGDCPLSWVSEISGVVQSVPFFGRLFRFFEIQIGFMKDINEIELHDGNLMGVNLNPIDGTLIIDLDYYPADGSGERIRAKLMFTGVAHVSQILDFKAMQDHAGFGNISYWVTGESPGVTYIYLARGLISINSKTVEFVSGT